MGKIVETKWKSFMGKDTIALSLNEDLDGPYTVSNLIELLQAVKEKFGDKNILIHDEQNNLVCGFRDIYLEPGFSFNYDGITYNVDCEIHISF